MGTGAAGQFRRLSQLQLLASAPPLSSVQASHSGAAAAPLETQQRKGTACMQHGAAGVGCKLGGRQAVARLAQVPPGQQAEQPACCRLPLQRSPPAGEAPLPLGPPPPQLAPQAHPPCMPAVAGRGRAHAFCLAAAERRAARQARHAEATCSALASPGAPRCMAGARWSAKAQNLGKSRFFPPALEAAGTPPSGVHP